MLKDKDVKVKTSMPKRKRIRKDNHKGDQGKSLLSEALLELHFSIH